MAFAVVVDKIEKLIWLGIEPVLLEGIVLLIFRKKCPLTILVRKYSDSTKYKVDIYLPTSLAKTQ